MPPISSSIAGTSSHRRFPLIRRAKPSTCCARRTSRSSTATTRCTSATGSSARWEATVAERRRRPDSPDYFLSLIPNRGQAELTAADLAWLRALPGELSLDGARKGDVYVCHGMPGNPFATIWDTDPGLDPGLH